MYIIKWEHTWTWNVKTWSELAMSYITRCTTITWKIAESWSRLWSQVTCLNSRRPSTPVIRIPVNWWSLFNIQEFHFILHLHNLCIHFLVDLVTLHDYERILFNWIFKFHSMVAYFCHHLSDNYVDLSDLYVDLSVIYVDLSIIMSTCQKNITTTSS